MYSLKMIRWLVGYVFFISGFLKLVTPGVWLTFKEYGILYPTKMVLIIGITELLCGLLLFLNYEIKKATVPLILIMIGAIVITKIPLLASPGVATFLFQSKLDVVMIGLLSIIYKEGS